MIPTQIKAIIFDVDGLIINSEPVWTISHDDFIEKHNLSVDATYKASLRGIGLKELVLQLKEKFHLEGDVDDLIADYRKTFYKHFLNSKMDILLHGVEECVKQCYEQGYTLAVASGGHTTEKLREMLQQFNLLKFFSVIVSSDEVHRGKPNPDVFLYTANKLGREPSECLVIEDSVNGILAGKRADMLVFGVNSDEKFCAILKENGADEVFHDLTQIQI